VAFLYSDLCVIFTLLGKRGVTIIIRSILDKTPYELLKGRKPNFSHLRVFGCKCFILNNGKDKHGKFDVKVDDGIFLGYSSNSKAYRVLIHGLSLLKSPFMLLLMRHLLKKSGKVILVLMLEE